MHNVKYIAIVRMPPPLSGSWISYVCSLIVILSICINAQCVCAQESFKRYPQSYKVSYEAVQKDRNNHKLRQQYLDQIFKELSRDLRYIKNLFYVNDYAKIKNSLLLAEYKKLHPDVDHLIIWHRKANNIISNSLMFIVCFAESFGCRTFYQVNISPTALDKLTELEFIYSLYHENFHCRDIYNGITIKGTDIDLGRLSPGLYKPIVEVRAYYYQLKNISSIRILMGESFEKQIRTKYLVNMIENYYWHKNYLKNLDKSKLNDYTNEVHDILLKSDLLNYTPNFGWELLEL